MNGETTVIMVVVRLFVAVLTASGLVSAACSEEGNVRYLGRVNPATKELTWPSTGVAFTFIGTEASIGIESTTGENSVELTVDGEPTVILSVTAGSPISTSDLSYGNHTVSLRKRSEAQYGTIFLGNVTSDGIIHPDIAPTRQIEIIGDSISVGYGLDGVLPCVDSAAMQNNPKTAGALAAEALGADYSVVAWSGKGLVRNIATGQPEESTGPIIPVLYDRYGANDDENTYTFPESWNPDVVIIGLGTNDWSYLGYDENGNSFPSRPAMDEGDFTAGMVSFVREIQTHYPDAVFFLLSSPMLGDGWPPEQFQKTAQTNAIIAAVEGLNDENVSFLDWPQQGSDVGCDYHPNAATNAAHATILEDVIRETLGW